MRKHVIAIETEKKKEDPVPGRGTGQNKERKLRHCPGLEPGISIPSHQTVRRFFHGNLQRVSYQVCCYAKAS